MGNNDLIDLSTPIIFKICKLMILKRHLTSYSLLPKNYYSLLTLLVSSFKERGYLFKRPLPSPLSQSHTQIIGPSRHTFSISKYCILDSFLFQLLVAIVLSINPWSDLYKTLCLSICSPLLFVHPSVCTSNMR